MWLLCIPHSSEVEETREEMINVGGKGDFPHEKRWLFYLLNNSENRWAVVSWSECFITLNCLIRLMDANISDEDSKQAIVLYVCCLKC